MTAPVLPSSGPSPDPTALDAAVEAAVEAAARALWEDVFIWTDDDDLIPWTSVDEPTVRTGMLGDARTVVEAIAPIIAAAVGEQIAAERTTGDHAWHSVWLHGDWRWLTRSMSTPQRELAAAAVERVWAEFRADDGEEMSPESHAELRWWDAAAIARAGTSGGES